ncbi:hypothetical protein M426DRAFT_24329 [Hypoxylon sp. CI-4A]|nr:hypothetical protein M426DRAFT_24329 [Hypoxylon sp. CI-4A]
MELSRKARVASATCLLVLSVLVNSQALNREDVLPRSITTIPRTTTSTISLKTTTTTTTTTSSPPIINAVATTSIPTSATSPSSTSTNLPGITHIPDTSIILAVVPISNPSNHIHAAPDQGAIDKHQQPKQQSRFFIDATGCTNAQSCRAATPFTLTHGRLSSSTTTNSNTNSNSNSNTNSISTDRDIMFQPLLITRHTTGTIASTFSVVDGLLRWFDPGFHQGRARYCLQPGSGILYVAFHNRKTWLPGCAEVDVEVYLAGQCREGEIVGGALVRHGIAGPVAVATAVDADADLEFGVGVGRLVDGDGGGDGVRETAGMEFREEL